MSRLAFAPSFVEELREILLSTSAAEIYPPGGGSPEIRDEPFLGEWRLRRLAYDPGRGRSRVVCVLTAGGRDVTATVDASDFPDLSGNSSQDRAWNESAYHDLAVLVSILIQEQILTMAPDEVPGEVRIQRPAGRAARS